MKLNSRFIGLKPIRTFLAKSVSTSMYRYQLASVENQPFHLIIFFCLLYFRYKTLLRACFVLLYKTKFKNVCKLCSDTSHTFFLNFIPFSIAFFYLAKVDFLIA